MARTPLYVGDILGWADEFHERFGRWPHRDDGPVEGTFDLTWRRIDSALKLGSRGLRRGSSLAKLLLARRKRRHKGLLPGLSDDQILEWADRHHTLTGEWPILSSGGIPGVQGETWNAVDHSLRIGRRGLPGNSSLAQLLEARRGVRNVQALPDLTIEEILSWADAFHDLNGEWPVRTSGMITGTMGESWSAIAQALIVGGRGLPEKTSLARLLARHRGARNHMDVPRMSTEAILDWADAYRETNGKWPTRTCGAIPETVGETWSMVDAALVVGLRGLPGGDSLARLLARNRGVRNKQALPKLSLDQIRQWIVVHHKRTGEWPRPSSGPIPQVQGETWAAVNSALIVGGRGLVAGSSLYRVVCDCRERTALV